MKKFLSLLLAIVMIVSIFPAQILSASAATQQYVKVTAAPSDWTGTYLIVYESGNVAFNGGLSTLDAVSNTINVTISNNAIDANDTVNAASFEIDSNGYIKSASGYYIGQTSNANGLKSSTSNTYTNTLSVNSDGTVNIVSGGAYLRYNATSGQYRFRYYKSSSYTGQKAIYLYKLETADSGECTHANTVEVAEVAATCTTPGYTAGVQCSDCEAWVSGHEVIAATDHAYGDWMDTTAATCTEAGEQSATCAKCGDVKTQTVAALGHNYVDGTCTGCGNVAVMTNYELVTDAASLKDGDQLIFVGANADGAYSVMIPYVSGNNLKAESINAPVDGKISLPDTSAAAIITLGGDSTGWTFFDGTYYLYAAGGTSSNHLKGKAELPTDNTGAWTISIVDGVTTITNVGNTGDGARNTVKFNYGNSPVLFSCYKADYATNVNPVSIYRLATAEPDVPACAHENTTTETVDATCTAAGSITVVCDDCGETISTEEIAALGHSYENDICTNCGAEFEGEVDTPDVKIIFELGENKTASHDDGTEATTYTETVDGYTLSITDGTKMYTGAVDAAGNGCIKLGTSKAVGGFKFSVPDNVIKVVICVAKYKANTTKINVNGTDYNLSNASSDGAYDEITVDTSSNKTVTVTTVSGGVRAMVNSIAYICGETDHTCQWDEGTVTTAATCTTDGVLTYSCTVEGCTTTKTETIKATGHSYTYTETAITCSNCDYSQAYTLSTIEQVNAAGLALTNKTYSAEIYYAKGIVTYISGKSVYLEDNTGGFCVYFATAPEGIALGDEYLVWDNAYNYNGLIEFSGTALNECIKVSSGNELPHKSVTIAELAADTSNSYLGERVTIENVTIGTINTSGNTALTDADGNTINIYKVSGLAEDINENDTVTVTAIVSSYNGYQLLINPGTAAADVVETASGEEEVVTTVTIAEAKAGTAGEYYQVEGTVTYISGRNVYIQDATGGIVVYLTANAATTQVGDKVKAYGALKVFNGLIELDAVDETNSKFYEILSSGNNVDAQTVTIVELNDDEATEYLAEKIALENVYVSYYSYSASYGNVTYTLIDGNGNTIQIYRVPVASEEECVAGGSIVNVEAVVSVYATSTTEGNGYRLLTDNNKITVTGTCAHEATELVVETDPTYTTTGVGNKQCTVCQNYVEKDVEIEKLPHPVTDYYISLSDNIGVNFVIELAETDVVTATVAGEAVEVQIVDGTVSVEVAAAQMTDEILLFVNDKVLDASYSVRGYADVILTDANNEYSNETKALVKAMLVYGGASQTVFNYNVDNSASKDITDAPAYDLEVADEIVQSDNISAVNFYGASLSYRNKIAVRFYFTADSVEGVTFKVGETEYKPVATNGMYYIEVAGILPQNIGEQITVTVTDAEENAISVSYGPMNYIERMNAKGSEAVQALVKALFNYYKAANAYIDSLTKLPEDGF